MILLLSGTQRLSAPPIGNTSQLTGREIPECVSVYWKEERDMLTFGIWIYHAACYLKDVIVQEEERSTREICSGQTENARNLKIIVCAYEERLLCLKVVLRTVVYSTFDRVVQLSALSFCIASLLVHFELQYNMNVDPQQE
ncbi:hypothetical protein F4703DRAFT_1794636 [Phycomyces blakesleeanus]